MHFINCCQAVPSQYQSNVSCAYSSQRPAVLSWLMIYLTTCHVLVSISSSVLQWLVCLSLQCWPTVLATVAALAYQVATGLWIAP